MWQHWAVVKLMMSQSNTSFWCEAICICKIVGRKYISLSKIYGEVKRNIMKFQKSNARKNFLIKKGKFGIHSVFLGLAVDLQVVCVLEFVIIAINTAMRNAETLSALPPNFEPCHGLKATGLWVEGHGLEAEKVGWLVGSLWPVLLVQTEAANFLLTVERVRWNPPGQSLRIA